VRELAEHAVRVLDIGSATDCHQADLRDIEALRAGLRDIDVVLHLGGIDRSVAADDAATMQVNATGTWNLFEASLQMGVRRVIHCSSSSVLGLDRSNPKMPPCYLPIDEAHPLRPTDAYGLSKACGERIAEAFSRRGLEVIIIRPCFVAFPDMADFMAGKPGPEGRSEPMPYLRTFVGPEDCARGFAAAATADMPVARLSSSLRPRHLRTNRPSPGCRRCTVCRSLCAIQRSISGSLAHHRLATQRHSSGSAGVHRHTGRRAQSRLDCFPIA